MSIKKLLIYFLPLCLLLFVHIAKAQTDTSTTVVEAPPMVDSAEVTTIEDFEVKKAKANFDSIDASNTAVITQRNNTDNAVRELKKDDDFWYVNATEKKKQPTESKDYWQSFFNFLTSENFRLISWIILGVLMIAAIALYLKNNQIGIFSAASKKIKQEQPGYDAMPENIMEVDYETAIAAALADNNYRVATRLLFLRSLKTLSIKNIITYGVDKTNFDYLFEISSTPYYNGFANAARNYEYVWYGNFDVNDQQFSLLKKGFDNFEQQLAA